ncbi:unnamed protein product [Staurois parvus]|uniref:Trans-1,2-dihydrobenzene-1,2-diol dehydrogenase n=1 Tax=Staurois parvus TaxID=386267 RepID=A0ABN9HFY3_9NEOB|nr:unnamed protein product [Staurois parvus]
MCMEKGKNVLCEKPLAMNLTEVNELISAARKHNVFLMEAFWSRFFPVYEKIRSLLNQKALGEVKIVRAEFGVNLLHVPRSVEKELGGGALLDIGCYCIQFALMAFGGEKPESITAKGFLHETGVDETVTVILQYSGKRQAVPNLHLFDSNAKPSCDMWHKRNDSDSFIHVVSNNNNS